MAFIDEVRSVSEALAVWGGGRPAEGPDLPFPHAEDLPGALLDLAVPHADINEIVAVHRAAGADLAALRDRCAWRILEELGTVYDGNADVRPLPARLGAAGRLLFVYVAVAVAPHTRRCHEERGVDPDVTRHSLAAV